MRFDSVTKCPKMRSRFLTTMEKTTNSAVTTQTFLCDTVMEDTEMS